MLEIIYYYANPGQPAKDKFPDLSVTGKAYNVLRWLKANRERGYLGFGNCNALTEHFFWHYPCDFCMDSRGWPIGPDANIHYQAQTTD